MTTRDVSPPRALTADAHEASAGRAAGASPKGPGITRAAPPPGAQATAPTPEALEAPPDVEPATATTEHLVSSGVTGLDAQFGGGLPAGNMVLVAAEPTTATSTFAAQYAAAGLDAGETVIYLSLQHPAEEVQATVARFLDEPSKIGRMHVIDGYPMQFREMPAATRRTLGIAAGEDPLDTLEELLADPQLAAPVRFVVSSFTELSWLYDADRILQDLRLLRAVLRRLQGTALVMVVTPLHEPGVVANLRHLCDGVIEFDLERKGFGLYPYISVTKMRGVAGSARLLVYKETETGLWIESTKRVF